MKITFFGTSHGVPMEDRFCACTLVEVQGRHYMIDCGAPAMDLLLRYKIDLESLKAVLVTHAHSDHQEGMFGMISLMQWYYKTMSFDIYHPRQAWLDFFEQYLILVGDGYDRDRTRFHHYAGGVVVDDGFVKITAIPTKHIPDSHAFLLEAEGKKVLFTGDLHKSLEDFPAVAKEEELDAIICEMAHFAPEVVQPHLLTCKTKNFFFNHLFPMHKANAVLAMDKMVPFPVRHVNDGDVIYL